MALFLKLHSRGYGSALERHRMEPRAAFAEERFGGRHNGRAEASHGEGVKRQKTRGKFDGGEAALAKEPAQKIRGRFVPFLRVAFQAARDEISIRVPSQCGLRHHMVQALHLGGEAAEAVKAPAVLALVDRLAKGLGLQEIGFLKIVPGGRLGGILGFDLLGAGRRRENFVGQAHFDNMARFAALDQTQNALAKEAAQPLPRGANGKASSMGEPADRKTEAELSLEATVPEKMKVNRAVDDRKAKARDEMVFDLFAHEFGVGFFGFHGLILKVKLRVES